MERIIKNMYKFPSKRPIESPEELGAWQMFLLSEAEKRFGKRDSSKKLCHPAFGKRPIIRFTIDKIGVFAELSNNSKNYWPTAIYELAHETVHLLNPIVGDTNYLEEGVAVAFAIEMSKITNHHIKPHSDQQSYLNAWTLAKQLPGDIYNSAKRIREYCGALGAAKPKDIEDLFPGIDKNLAKKLCKKFERNNKAMEVIK